MIHPLVGVAESAAAEARWLGRGGRPDRAPLERVLAEAAGLMRPTPFKLWQGVTVPDVAAFCDRIADGLLDGTERRRTQAVRMLAAALAHVPAESAPYSAGQDV